MDSLRSLRENVRSEFKVILADIERITTPFPEVYKLETCLENLRRERTSLRKLDSAIIDLVDEELEEELEQADSYTLCFFHAEALLNHYISCRKKRVPPQREPPDRRLEELIKNLEDHSAKSHTRIPDAIHTDTKSGYPGQSTPPEPVKGDSENLSSVVELSEPQTDPVESNVARAPEEPCVEPPPCDFEYIFIPDIMKGEAMPELRGTFIPDIMKGEAMLELRGTALTHAFSYLPGPSAHQGSLLGRVAPETAACIESVHEGILASGQGSSRGKHRRPRTCRQSNVTVNASKSIPDSKTPTRKCGYRRCSRRLPLMGTADSKDIGPA